MFLIPGTRNVARNGRALYVNSAFDRLFDDALASVFGPRGVADADVASARAPALDVTESERAYTVTVDLPGIAKEDVKVSIDGRQVTLEAQSQTVQEKKDGERVLYRERSVSSFSRSFTLPVEVDQSASQARLDNGVLTLTLAKKVAPAAAQLTIN